MGDILWAVAVMGGLGLICGGLLYTAARVFYTYEDPRIDEVSDLLPGSNCGGCGLPGCRALAEALVVEDPTAKCPVCSAEQWQAIGRTLGRDLGSSEAMIAIIKCKGTYANAVHVGKYQGIRDCRIAHMTGTSDKVCPYGCVGMGTCARVCPYDAIVEKDGIVEVIRDKCVGCGKCVEVCPRNVIELAPESDDVVIACVAHDKGALVRDYCKVGCIMCKQCIKVCPVGAIDEDRDLAVIDYEKCVACAECVSVCPKNTIDALIPGINRRERLPNEYWEKKELEAKAKEEKRRLAAEKKASKSEETRRKDI